MIRLFVDIGNSRFKSAIERGGQLEPLKTFAWHDVFLHEVLSGVWLDALNGETPDSIHVSNVAGDRCLPNLNAWCCKIWNQQPIAMVSTETFKNLTNGYDEPATLGVDRWAAMIGALEQYSGALCVIDSGTATTVDVIKENGEYIGGAILPGIYTMRRSLGKYTAALFAADGDITPFSTNTASGIAGGTGYASVGAIERLIDEAVKAVGPVTTVVTGGEGGVLESLMTRPAQYDPILVLHGVRAFANELRDSGKFVDSSCPTT
jgi:type III pantothenate kinase